MSEDFPAVTAGTSTDSDVFREAELFKQRGNAALSNKDYATSIQFYTKAINLLPQNPIYLCNRAAAYSQSNLHEQARIDAQSAVDLDPKYAKAWSRLGLAKSKLRDFEGSMQAYRKGIECEGSGGSKLMKEGYEAAKQKVLESGSTQRNIATTPQTMVHQLSGDTASGSVENNARTLLGDSGFEGLFHKYLDNLTLDGSSKLSSQILDQIFQNLAASSAPLYRDNSTTSSDQTASEKTNLSNTLADTYEETGKIEYLEHALRVARESVAAQPRTYSTRVKCLYNLSNRLHARYDKLGQIVDVEEAISYARQAVDITPAEHEYLPKVLANLSDKLKVRFLQIGKPDDLEESFTLSRTAVALTPSEDPNLGERLYILAHTYCLKFYATGEIVYLDEGIRKGQEALACMATDSPKLPEYQKGLSCWFYSRFQKNSNLNDINESVMLIQRSLKSTVKDSKSRSLKLTLLAQFLAGRFQATSNAQDIDNSIMAARRAIELDRPSSDQRPSMLSQLGTSLESRYLSRGNLQDLEEAIIQTEECIKKTPPTDKELAGRLGNYGNMLNDRFIHTGNVADLEKSIVMARRAIAMDKDSAALNNLSSKLLRRYERTGDMQDLEETISTGEEALLLAKESNPRLPGWLANISTVLTRRYERVGDPEDLEKAINKSRQALEDSRLVFAQRGSALNTLSLLLYYRFDRTGSQQDLDEAIEVARSALIAVPTDHPELITWQTTLATAIGSRYERNGDIQDGTTALSLLQQAVLKTPKGDPRRPLMLNNLSMSMMRRYEKTNDLKELDNAINIIQESIAATPKHHPGLWQRKMGLAAGLLYRYTHTGHLEDLDESIKINREVIQLVPKHHQNMSKCLSNLGSSVHVRYWKTFDDRDKTEALDMFLKAHYCENALPLVRIHSALKAIVYLRRKPDWQQASIVSKEAIRLLPLVSSRTLDRDDQQYTMAQSAGLAASAGSIALQVGNGKLEALELLELGRGVVLSHLMNSRNDIWELEQAFPELAKRFEIWRTELNQGGNPASSIEMWTNVSDRRIKADRELDSCLQEIRLCKGFDRFLLGPSETELRKMAMDGPIVVVNVTEIRSDAILVTPSGVECVQLHDMTYDQTAEWVGKDLTHYSSLSERGKKNAEYRQFLSWLWVAGVKHILKRLQSNPPKLIHIWWIGVGIASSLPFHAAGVHSKGSTENTFNHAISSYTPTIKALSYARNRTQSTLRSVKKGKHENPKLLLVSMLETPGQSSLPGVAREMLEIQTSFRSKFEITHLAQPTAEIVLESLDTFDMVHFACHALSDLRDPSNSHLLLQGVGKPDGLSVRSILDMDLHNAKIAYLSACSTAESKVAKLADEVIHLASAFQVAGFGHVVGAMWPSDDDICVDMAKDFYGLLKSNNHQVDGVAEALHTAVQKVRCANLRQPLLWAQYIHVGC